MPKTSTQKRTRRWTSMLQWLGGDGCALLLLVVVAALAVFLARDPLRQQVSTTHETEPTAILEQVAVPDWMKEAEFRAELADAFEQLKSANLPPAEQLGRAIQTSTWVRHLEVHQRDGRLSCDVTFRQPLLGVVWGNYCCYVDEDGVCLDWTFMTPEAGATCWTVRGVSTTGTPRPGKILEIPQLAALARLAAELEPVRRTLPLDTLRLVRSHASADSPVLEITSRRGDLVRWGSLEDDNAFKTRVLLGRLHALAPNSALPQTIDLRAEDA